MDYPKMARHAPIYSVALSGNVDRVDRDRLDELETAYQVGAAVDIVVDLDHVVDLGQAGLQTLAVLYRDATERGGTVTVVRAPHKVVRAIKESGLDRMLILSGQGSSEEASGDTAVATPRG